MPTVTVQFADAKKDNITIYVSSFDVKYNSFYSRLLSNIGKGYCYTLDNKILTARNDNKLSALGFTDKCTIIAHFAKNPNQGIALNDSRRIDDITEITDLERSFTTFDEAQKHFRLPRPSLFNVSTPFSNYVAINFQDKYNGARPDEKFKWIVHSVENAQNYGFSCPEEAAIGFEFVIGTMDWLFARAQIPGAQCKFANKQAYEKALKIPNVHRLIYDRIVNALESPIFVKPLEQKQVEVVVEEPTEKQAEVDESDVIFEKSIEVNASVQNSDGYESFMAKLEYKSGGPKLGLDIFHYQSRVLVSRCDPDSLAAIQFKVGDCILGIDGTPVTDKDVARHILLNSLQSQGFATVLIGRPQNIGFRQP